MIFAVRELPRYIAECVQNVAIRFISFHFIRFISFHFIRFISFHFISFISFVSFVSRIIGRNTLHQSRQWFKEIELGL